ncbi:pre-mRNA-splicing factor SYF2 [Coemansia sp. RSA 552]|nr:pre-mRNA-splicing factor SYF2 [Coemansia sp. RSA 552]
MSTSKSPEPKPVDVEQLEKADEDSLSSSDDSSSGEEESDVDVTERSDIPEDLQPQVERLRALRQRLAQSTQDNKKEVYQEHQRKHEDPREQRRQSRKRREAQILQHREEYAGEDYERSRFMDYSIEQVERYEERKRQREENRELGFTDYDQVNQRKYERDVAKIKPNLAAYRQSKQEGSRDDPQNVNRLAQAVVEQQKRRARLNKPTIEKEGEDVSYINEHNARFNRKINRAYDKYTKEIRDNFERGTAL